MTLNFKEWLMQENLWGNIPVKGRKPSDGWNKPSAGPMPGAMPSGPKMMKKMKK
jgi:hypothetical protein